MRRRLLLSKAFPLPSDAAWHRSRLHPPYQATHFSKSKSEHTHASLSSTPILCISDTYAHIVLIHQNHLKDGDRPTSLPSHKTRSRNAPQKIVNIQRKTKHICAVLRDRSGQKRGLRRATKNTYLGRGLLGAQTSPIEQKRDGSSVD